MYELEKRDLHIILQAAGVAGGSGAVHRQLGVVATSWGAGCAMVTHQTNHVSETNQRLVKQKHSARYSHLWI